MKTETQTLGEIFSDAKSYEIPVYQRAYAWDIQGWSSLGADFNNLHGKLLNVLPKNLNDRHVDIEDITVVKHFIGAIVLYQHGNNSNKFHIVDGQQRITTMMLMACGLLNVIKYMQQNGHTRLDYLVARLVRLLKVDSGLHSPEKAVHELHKLQLSVRDRQSYSEIVEKVVQPNYDMNTNDHNESPCKIYECYNFFSQMFHEYIAEYIQEPTHENLYSQNILASIVATLENCFHFAVITVDKEENPQEIFESLNARSKPLNSFDLIKNYVLMELNMRSSKETGDKSEIEKRILERYENDWKHLETDYFWDEDKRQSREKRMDIVVDNKIVFLNYWLDAHYCKNSSVEKQSRLANDSDVRFNARDAVFWAYRGYLKSYTKNRAKDEEANKYEDIADFSIQIGRDAKFYFQALRAIDQGLVYSKDYNKKEFSVLHELSKKYNIHPLLDFISRAIQGFEQRALWKQIFWLIKDRPENQKIPEKEFNKYLSVLDNWSTRKFLVDGRFVTDLNTATTRMVRYMIDQEEASKKGKDPLAVQAGTLLEKFLLEHTKAKHEYLAWPSDDEIRSALLDSRSFTSTESLNKLKYVLVAIENKYRGFNDFSSIESGNNSGLQRVPINCFQANFILPSDRIKKKWAGSISTAVEFDEDEKKDRDRHQKSIGNVILIQTIDEQIMRLPKHNNWHDRKKHILDFNEENSSIAVMMNKKLLNKSDWRIQEIADHTNDLVDDIISIWKYPVRNDILTGAVGQSFIL